MTLQEGMESAQEQYDDVQKIRWLSKLDGTIKAKIIDTHEGGENVVFNGYDENTASDTVLLVPAPFDDIYKYWIESRIHYANGETAKYNNAVAMFNAVYSEFCNHHNRTHMPKGSKIKY